MLEAQSLEKLKISPFKKIVYMFSPEYQCVFIWGEDGGGVDPAV